MITLQNIILYKNISCPSKLLEQIKIIATHTKNTWQALYIATQIENGVKV